MQEPSLFYTIWGIGCEKISILDMLIRACSVYIYGIVLMRIFKRFMGIRTVFNFMLFVMLGSLMAASIIENTLFVPILLTVTLLMVVNGLLAIILYYVPSLENFIKGHTYVLIENGQINWKNMKKLFITENDLLEALHTNTNAFTISEVEHAIFEHNGTITFKLYKK